MVHIPIHFSVETVFKCYVNFALRSLHHMCMGSDADVSKVYVLGCPLRGRFDNIFLSPVPIGPERATAPPFLRGYVGPNSAYIRVLTLLISTLKMEEYVPPKPQHYPATP
jgi:hypothetical protein